MTTAVITIVSGRHDHLRNQQRGLRSGTRLPDHYVVVAMDDPAALQVTVDGPLAGSGCAIHLVRLAADDGLPLAAARNAGATAALAAGADILGLPGRRLCSVTVAGRHLYQSGPSRGGPRPALRSGALPRPRDRRRSNRIGGASSAGRILPDRIWPPGRSTDSADWQLFWSLSFAVSNLTWQKLGGFCEDYRGYGAEDTDFGYSAFLAGVNISWLGGADAFHQYHDTQDPPVQHLRDIVSNATVFHRRWGFWPMQGWLTAFRELGLVGYSAESDRWMITPTAAGADDETPPRGVRRDSLLR